MANAVKEVETVEAVTGITLELSPKEAVHLYLLMGRTVGSGEIRVSAHSIWDCLNKVMPHIVSDFYENITEDLTRIKQLDDLSQNAVDKIVTYVKSGG